MKQRLPRMYAESTLNRMYRALNWEPEQCERFRQYFDAAAGLYGIIPMHRLLHIVRKYGETVSDEEFYAFAEIMRHERHFYMILGEDEIYTDGIAVKPADRELIHDSLILYQFEGYDELQAEQQGKAYYIPPDRDAFLRYAADGYFERTPQTEALLQFLRRTFRAHDPEDLLDEIMLTVHAELGDPVSAVLDDLERMKIVMNQQLLRAFLPLMQELCNHTRIQQNRGYTPDEMYRLYHGTRIRDTRGDEPAPMKLPVLAPPAPSAPSKNGPCPCGSGKKYKRCCGKS